MIIVDPRYQITIVQDRAAGQERNSSIPTPDGMLNNLHGNVDLIAVEAYLPEKFRVGINSEYNAPFAEGIFGGLGAVPKLFVQAFLGKMTTQAMTFQFWEGSAPIDMEFELTFVARDSTLEDVRAPIANLKKLALPSASGINTNTANDNRNNDPYRLLQPPGPKVDFDKEFFLSQVTDPVQKAKADAAVGDITSNVRKGNYVEAFSAIGTFVSNSAVGRGAKAGLTNPFTYLKFTNNIQMMVGKMLYFPSVVITGVSAEYDTRFDEYGRAVKATVGITLRTFFTPTAEDVNTMMPIHTTGINAQGEAF